MDPQIDDLIIATSQGVFAFQRGTLNCIHHGFGIYFGISWDEKWVYLAAQRSYRWPRFRGMDNILVLDPDFNWVGSIQGLNFHALHQIFFFDDRLFICNTGRNRIDILTMLMEEDIPRYSMTEWKYKQGNHVNSIWIDGGARDGDVIYVVEHRHGPSKVKYFDKKFEFLGEETGLGDKMHNVYVEDGKLFVCSSEAECIIIRDLSTGEDRVINTSQYAKGLPRGLARTPGRWYIGISERAIRNERHIAHDGVVLVLDDDFKLIKRIPLKNVGQVLEIRAMTGSDRAHNGIPFPRSIRTLIYELPKNGSLARA